MGSQDYEAARKLEATTYYGDQQLDRTAAFEAGRAYGYAEAVEDSYPELWTTCSAHQVFDSHCRQCTGGS